MKIKSLKKRPNITTDKKLDGLYTQFDKLLKILETKELPEQITNTINNKIDHINALSASDTNFRKELKKTQTQVIKLIEKELKLVTQNHYRNTWLALGMAAFGIPLGVAFGASLGSMAFIGIGLPIGMVIGMAVGTNMDKKALEEGRQLDLEIKH